MKLELEKIKNAIPYFCHHTDKEKIGTTKLYKLFYFADFRHLKRYGRLIFGDRYYHLDRGPVPTNIKSFVDNVRDSEETTLLSGVCEIKRRVYLGGEQHHIKPLLPKKKIDLNFFSKVEQDILTEVCKEFYDASAKTIEEASHEEAPWKKTTYGQEIDFILAAEDKDCRIPMAILAKHIEIFSSVR